MGERYLGGAAGFGFSYALADADVVTTEGQRVRIHEDIRHGQPEHVAALAPAWLTLRSGIDAQNEFMVSGGLRRAGVFGRHLFDSLDGGRDWPSAVHLAASAEYGLRAHDIAFMYESFPLVWKRLRLILGLGGGVGLHHHYMMVPRSLEPGPPDNYIGPVAGLEMYQSEARITAEIGVAISTWMTILIQPYFVIAHSRPEVEVVHSQVVVGVERFWQPCGFSFTVVPSKVFKLGSGRRLPKL